VLWSASKLPRPKRNTAQEETMLWKKPRIVEVAVGQEINCYACAEMK
jgi:coenzyme PQQ precursor peptide PqqA